MTVSHWGWSLPWRLMLPVIPFLALFVSYVIEGHPSAIVLGFPLLALSLGLSLVAAPKAYALYPTGTGVLEVGGLDRVQHLFPSMYYTPVRVVPAIRGRWPTGAAARDGDADVVCAMQGANETGLLSWGIRGGVLPGEFSVTFALKAEGADAGSVLGSVSLMTNGRAQRVAHKELTSSDFPVAQVYQPIELRIHSERALDVETLVSFEGRGRLCLAEVTFQQLSTDHVQQGHWPAAVASSGAALLGAVYGIGTKRRERPQK